jgi:hypothetical protein
MRGRLDSFGVMLWLVIIVNGWLPGWQGSHLREAELALAATTKQARMRHRYTRSDNTF